MAQTKNVPAAAADVDDMPHIDFTAVPDMKALDAGKYNASVVEAKPGRSKSSNSPKIDIRWKIDSGRHEGRMVYDTISFHPNALWRAKATLKAINPAAFPDEFSGGVDADDLIGQSAVIQLTIDENSGTDPQTGEPYAARNRVYKVYPYGTQVSDDDILD